MSLSKKTIMTAAVEIKNIQESYREFYLSLDLNKMSIFTIRRFTAIMDEILNNTVNMIYDKDYSNIKLWENICILRCIGGDVDKLLVATNIASQCKVITQIIKKIKKCKESNFQVEKDKFYLISINSENVEKLIKFLKSQKAYQYLPYGDWGSGGCYILALALKDMIGESAKIKVIGRKINGFVVDHAVIEFDNFYLDYNGLQSKEMLIENFKKEWCCRSDSSFSNPHIEDIDFNYVKEKDLINSQVKKLSSQLLKTLQKENITIKSKTCIEKKIDSEFLVKGNLSLSME